MTTSRSNLSVLIGSRFLRSRLNVPDSGGDPLPPLSYFKYFSPSDGESVESRTSVTSVTISYATFNGKTGLPSGLDGTATDSPSEALTDPSQLVWNQGNVTTAGITEIISDSFDGVINWVILDGVVYNFNQGPPTLEYVLKLSGTNIITLPSSVPVQIGESVSACVRVLDTSAPRVLWSSVSDPKSYAYISAGTINCSTAETILVDGFETNIFPDDGDMHTVEIFFNQVVNLDRFGLSHTNIFPLEGEISDIKLPSGEVFAVNDNSNTLTGDMGGTLTLSGGTWSQYDVTGNEYWKLSEDYIKVDFEVEDFFTCQPICGQSNAAGSTAIVTNTVEYSGQNKRYQDGVPGGPIVDQKEYLSETIASGMTNALITTLRKENKNPQPVFITENHGVGGRDYEAIKKGGTEPNAYPKFLTELTAIQSEKNTIVKVFHLVHGEADLFNPWETYRDNLIQFLNDYTGDCKAITGQTFDPIMVVSQISSQQVYTSTLDVVESPLALLDVCRKSPRHFSCGPQYWINTNGVGDYPHLDGRDQIISGEYRKKVYDQVVEKGDTETPTATLVKSATISGNTITVEFDVPVPPLQFENDYIPSIANEGFVYSDDSGNTITGLQANIDNVVITLSGNAGTNPDLQYAWFNGTNGVNGTDGGPRGTLCDSETATSVNYPSFIMRNYALSFRFATGYFEFS